MDERVYPSGGDVGINAPIVAGIEALGRIAAFAPASLAVMVDRIDSGRCDIGICDLIAAAIEYSFVERRAEKRFDRMLPLPP